MHVPNLIQTLEMERSEFFPSLPLSHLLLSLEPSSMAPRKEHVASRAQGNVERLVLTSPCSILWRSTGGINNILLKDG